MDTNHVGSNASTEVLTSDKSNKHAKSSKDKIRQKEHQLVSPKLAFLRRKIRHINRKAESDRESVLGAAVTNTSVQLFVAIYSILIFTRGAFRQYFPSVVEQIQRQFTMSMRELEFLNGVEKIGFMIFIVFVGYYGNKMHKPIGLVVGCVLCACGTALCSCPYFTNPLVGRPGNTTDMSLYYEAGLCQVDTNQTTTSKTQCEALVHHPDGGRAFSFIAGGNFLIGIGSTFLLTLGFVYIEESAHKDTSPLYYGIILFMNGAGECVGLITAWRFTKLPYTLRGSTGIESWAVGAWWLALPILATLFLFVSLPLLMFPKWIVEPRWLTHRRNRRLKRWLYLVKVEEKLVNKIKRRQRRKQRKEENARRKRENQRMENNRASVVGKTHVGNKISPKESESAVLNSGVNNAFEAEENDLDNRVDEEALMKRAQSATVRVEAEVHVESDHEGKAHDKDEKEEGTDEESEEEESATRPSSPGIDRAVEGQDNPELITEDIAAEQAASSSGVAQARGVHFAVDDAGMILAETRIEDILQMEEPPQEPLPLEDGELLKSDKEEKERRRKILGRRIQDLPKNLWFLLNRPVFSLILAGTVFAAYSTAGYQATLASYLSVHLAIYEPTNNLISGIPYTVGFSLGTLLSGIVFNKRGWRLMTHVKIIVTIQCIIIVLFLFGMIPMCNVSYFFGRSSDPNVTSSLDCSSRCDCRQAQYDPICTEDGLVFPSSCVAGCRTATIVAELGSVVYSNCLCVPDQDLSGVYCNKGCSGAAAGYGVLVFLIAACQNFGLVSLLIICFRGISQKLRSLSLGFAVAVVMLTAFVPGMAVFRAIRTVACSHQEDDCFGDSVCWLYDGDTSRYLQHGATSVFQLVSLIFYVAAVFVIRSKVKAAAQVTDPAQTGCITTASGASCAEELPGYDAALPNAENRPEENSHL